MHNVVSQDDVPEDDEVKRDSPLPQLKKPSSGPSSPPPKQAYISEVEEEEEDEEEEGSTDDEGSRGGKHGSGLRTAKPKPKKRPGRNARKKTQPHPEGPQRVPDLPAVDIVYKKLSNPLIRVAHEEKTIEVGVKAELFRSLSSSPPLEYEFKAWRGTVSK